MNVIRTPRLDLRSSAMHLLMADLEGADELARELDVDVPADWPPSLYDQAAIEWTIDRVTAGQREEFLLYYWVLREAETLVGLGGFKGPPLDGRIEIGYTLLPHYQGRGLATEAIAGLVKFAFEHGDVDEVFAETLPHLAASIGVLTKNNFEFLGPGSEEGVIQFGLSREKWRSHQIIGDSHGEHMKMFDEMLEAWGYTRAGLISEVENFPEWHFDEKPAKLGRTALDLVNHAVESGRLMAGELSRPDGDFQRKPYPELIAEHSRPNDEVHSKAAAIEVLRRSFDEGVAMLRKAGADLLMQPIRQFNGEDATRMVWMHHGIAHEEYHRGQIALYARLFGETPALTKEIYGS